MTRSVDGPGDEPLLPEQTSDETDIGWGDDRDPDEDVRRLVEDRPPHHEDRD